LKSQTGYVWIVTNGDTAYYFYRASREGSFLKESAYDSLELRQQRCLIHLLSAWSENLLNEQVLASSS
jgi:hypothetical protein